MACCQSCQDNSAWHASNSGSPVKTYSFLEKGPFVPPLVVCGGKLLAVGLSKLGWEIEVLSGSFIHSSLSKFNPSIFIFTLLLLSIIAFSFLPPPHYFLDIMATAVSKVRGETFNERSKGKDVRTSNVIAAKVSRVVIMSVVGNSGFDSMEERDAKMNERLNFFPCHFFKKKMDGGLMSPFI